MGSLSEQYRAQEEEKARSPSRNRIFGRTVKDVVVVVVAAAAFIYLVWVMLPPSGTKMYEGDRQKITNAVLAFRAGLDPSVASSETLDNLRAQSDSLKGQLPTYAQARFGTESALEEAAVGSGELTTLGVEQSNPIGGKGQSGTPLWEDVDGDGLRNIADEKLFYHNADPVPNVDHWNTTAVVAGDVEYIVDSRDWFIDIDLLAEKGYLEQIPTSASRDNSVQGTGNYSWYIDESGEVKSLLYSAPTQDSAGYQHNHAEREHRHAPWASPH